MNKNQLLEMFPIGPEHPDSRRFDPVTAIMGGGQILGGLVGAGMQSGAAKDAANIQASAARQAGDKVNTVTDLVNPAIGAAATTAGNQVVDTAGAGGNSITDAATQAGQGVTTAAGKANDILSPFIGAGTDALGTLSSILKPGYFNADTFKSLDPGFDFRLQQAQDALQRKQASSGAALGGGAAKQLDRYTQDYASNEFGGAYNRYLQGADRLQALAGMGLSAGNTAGQNTIGAAKYAGDTGLTGATTAAGLRQGAAEWKGGQDINAADLMGANSINAARSYGDFLTQGANARAAGTVGSANAWSNGITGGVNGATNLILLQKLLKNPATPAGEKV